MKKILFVLIATIIATLGCAVAPQESQEFTPDPEAIGKVSEALSSYTIVSTTSTLRGTLIRTEVVVSASANPLDRFSFIRVRKLTGATEGEVLLLPSLNSNAKEYEWTDVGVPYAQSMVGVFAHAGYEVWAFSPRTTSLTAGACAVPGACNVAATWGIQTYVEDIDFVRGVMRTIHPFQKPFIGGLSLGAMLTYATLDAHPYAYRGAIIWEGMLKSNDANFQSGFSGPCNGTTAALAGGQYTDDAFGSLMPVAYTLATTAPTAPSPLGIFPGFNNQQTFVALFAFPNPGFPIPVRGFIIDAGDPFVAQAFTYSNDYRVGQQILQGNYYEAERVERDFFCSLAGVETSFTDGLAAYNKPVLVIKAGLGFGDYADYNVSLLSSTDVTVTSKPTYGHADHYLSTTYQADSVTPILNWMNAH